VSTLGESAEPHRAERPPLTRRMFGQNSDSSMKSLVDGSSNTVMLAETMRLVWNGRGQTWGYAKHVGHGVDIAYPRGINFYHCCGWDSPPFERPDWTRTRLGDSGTVGSLHPGGAQVALGDASVRFISNTTELVTLQRLAMIADGQVLGEF
jgi:hypothetical protein